MRSEPDCHPARTARLSPPQAARLEAIVDSLSEQLGQNREYLEVLREKLADAVSLARWLRDYVRVDFTHEEVVDLVQALAQLHNEQLLSDEAHSAVCEMFEQMERGTADGRWGDRNAASSAKEVSLGR
jgi:hypothetical protein